ncbi:peptidylprolyl isomerase [Microbacterium resistens]|uniref:peptidylprolyl isomerase n=1 Tax=Microbacterium resistens TaxID=156977 RepID=A0ABU1SA27_9MICO|nr:FKBP-type peptidyl-prolyl cis-trans isomerase [Microbacterium resistens]MDR6866472.1 peptidylprolyl isomerase [Microbacterium resistens]
MRFRLLAAVSAVAASALLLAGCAGSGDSPDPTASAAAGSCMLDAKPGAASDAVTVSGEGKDTTVAIPEGTKITEVERTVVSKGSGKDVLANDLLSVRYQIIDAASNKVLESSERGEDGALPVLLDPQQSSLFVAALECQPLGSRIVLTLPSSVLGEGAQSVVVYAEATGELPRTATGKAVTPDKDFPAVELDKDGMPTIATPEGPAPTDTKVTVLKQGDGPTVASGDFVAVQYVGVKWSDGSVFDSSWKRGAPAQFMTTQVVTGFKTALEGQKVGSQVEVVMPPKDAYGEKSDSNTSDLAGESLVFVVDILATTPAQAPQQ